MVRQRLAEVFGREPNITINPDEVVAQGAAIQAGSLTGIDHRGHRHGRARRGRDGGALAAAVRRRDAAEAALAAAGAARRQPGDARDPDRRRLHRAPARQELADPDRAHARVHDRARQPDPRRDRLLPRRDRGATPRTSRSARSCSRSCRAKPRGDLKIEVSFRVDADGILHVRASDADSGAAPGGAPPGARRAGRRGRA